MNLRCFKVKVHDVLGGQVVLQKSTTSKVTPRGGATCDSSDYSETMVTCTLPSALGISLNEVFDVDSQMSDSGGFAGNASDSRLRTVVTCAAS